MTIGMRFRAWVDRLLCRVGDVEEWTDAPPPTPLVGDPVIVVRSDRRGTIHRVLGACGDGAYLVQVALPPDVATRELARLRRSVGDRHADGDRRELRYAVVVRGVHGVWYSNPSHGLMTRATLGEANPCVDRLPVPHPVGGAA